jgi:hypothetical protein
MYVERLITFRHCLTAGYSMIGNRLSEYHCGYGGGVSYVEYGALVNDIMLLSSNST